MNDIDEFNENVARAPLIVTNSIIKFLEQESSLECIGRCGIDLIDAIMNYPDDKAKQLYCLNICQYIFEALIMTNNDDPKIICSVLRSSLETKMKFYKELIFKKYGVNL